MQELAYVGNQAQLLHIKNYRFEGGPAHGLRATDITNQTGLSFTVLADRCMDIANLSYKGINMSFIGPCGYVAPQYCNSRGIDWLHSFTAGFMTTCGLDNIGLPCTDQGQEYGLHGRLSATPAEQYCTKTKKISGGIQAELTGEMNQSALFGGKLKLRRKIQTFQDQDIIEITDEIYNMGFEEQEYMLLYHCNIGYPFLSPGCEVLIDSESAIPRNQHSNDHMDAMLAVTEPDNLDEMCYYHKMKNRDGISRAGIYQPKHNIGMTISYQNHLLDHFIQWKNLSMGQYVMGLEPATNHVDGKSMERQLGRIKSISPQQIARHKLVFTFYTK